MISLVLFACSGESDSGDEQEDSHSEAPALSFLSPDDGETVGIANVEVSIVADNFTLHDPAKHNEGQPEGYISFAVDGVEERKTADQQFTITLTTGGHTLSAELFYEDGDPLDPPVTASVEVSAE